MNEAARIKLWIFGLGLLVMAAAFLTVQVNPLLVALAYLALLAGVVAIGLMTGLWGGLITSAVAVFGMTLFNQFAGLYLRESAVFNIATELAVYLLVGPAAGGAAEAVARLERRAAHWLEQAEASAAHDEALGTLKPAWAKIRLEEEFLRAAQFERPLTVAVLQMTPEPGRVNGRSQRVAALQSLIRIARALTRPPAVVAHGGGDQALLILPEYTPEAAQQLLRRLQTQAAGEPYFPPGQNGTLGAPLSEWGHLQVGLAAANGRTENSAALLAQAQSALTTHHS